jgi:uncharacterized protein
LTKLRVYLMGLLTLLMVPLAWLLQGMPSPPAFFRFDELLSVWTLIGIEFGLFFGAIMLLATSVESAKVSFRHQIQLIRSFRLHFLDCVFLSLCAGLGEEFLFRIALQEWLHPLLAAILFVAIHGYIHPTEWEVTKYGLLVLVFIVILSYAVNVQGIWFCIAAHASYDFLLFRYWSTN